MKRAGNNIAPSFTTRKKLDKLQINNFSWTHQRIEATKLTDIWQKQASAEETQNPSVH